MKRIIEKAVDAVIVIFAIVAVLVMCYSFAFLVALV